MVYITGLINEHSGIWSWFAQEKALPGCLVFAQKQVFEAKKNRIGPQQSQRVALWTLPNSSSRPLALIQVEKGSKLVSPIHTDDDGDNWQTTLYPTGDTEADRGDRMAIYLAAPNCDQLRGPGWWKSVRYRVSLVDTNSASQKLKVCL